MNSRIRTPFDTFILNPDYVAARSLSSLRSNQEPLTRSLQLSHIPVTAFSQTDLFLVFIFLVQIQRLQLRYEKV